MTITFLKNEPEQDWQTVQLSLGIQSYASHTRLTLAHIGKTYVNLARMTEDLERDDFGHIIEPEKIALSTDEMDALVEAWTTFKSQIEAKEQARAERIAAQYQEALALVASVKTNVPALDIKITADQHYPGRYVVEVPEFSFYDSVYSGDTGESDLVDAVKRAIARIDQNIARLENYETTGWYGPSKSAQLERTHAAKQITAWRAVRPLVSATEKESEQGIMSEDIDVAESMMEI